RLIKPAQNKIFSYQFKNINCWDALKSLARQAGYYILFEKDGLSFIRRKPPTDAEISKSKDFFMDGKRLFTLGQIKKALKSLEKSLSLNPFYDTARLYLIRELVRMGQFSRALSHIRFIEDQGKKESLAQAHFWKGRIYFFQGKSHLALKIFKKRLEKNEGDIQSAYYAGETAYFSGKEELAKDYFNKVIEIYQYLEDANADIYAFTGRACTYLKRYEDAQNMFEWALEKDSLHYQANLGQGWLYLLQKKLRKSEKAFEKVLQVYSHSVEALLGLAEIAYLRKDSTSFQKTKKKILGLTKEHYQIYFLQGRWFWKENRFGNAKQAFMEALKRKKDHLLSYLYLAACQKLLGDQKEYRLLMLKGRRKFQISQKTWDEKMGILLRGKKLDILEEANIHLSRGNYKKGEKIFQEIYQKDPSNHLALLGLAKINWLQGRYQKAIQQCQKVLTRKPIEEEGLAILLDCLLRLGRLKALSQEAGKWEKEISSSPIPPYFQGICLRQRGMYSEAKQEFQKAVSLGEKDQALALVFKARSHQALNQPHEANDAFYKAEEVAPLFYEAYIYHGLLFMEKYDFGYGRKLIKKVIEVNPSHPLALVALAQCDVEDYTLGWKRFQMARQKINKALSVNPDLEEAHLFLAHLALMDGNFPEAAKRAQRILKINPASLEGYAVLGALSYYLGKKEEFARWEKKVKSINPLPSLFYLQIADVLEDRFLYEDAMRLARKAIQLNPEEWQAYTIYGLNLLRTGDEKKGKDVLEKAYKADRFNVRILNTLNLLDEFGTKYKLYTIHPLIKVRMDVKESKILLPYAKKLALRAFQEMGKRYHYKLEKPILIEFFSKHSDFSVRTIGLPLIGALGVCFGRVVALDSPLALQKGRYSWGRTLWHELAHVITLAKTAHHIPRWFTEGLSVYEEKLGNKSWDREMESLFVQIYQTGRLRNILDLNEGFTRPRYGQEVVVCYYQGGLICDFVVKKWGFSKILEMLEAFRNQKSTREVVSQVLRLQPKEFDAEFHKYLKKRFSTQLTGPILRWQDFSKWQEETEQNPKSFQAWFHLAWAYYYRSQMVDAEIAAGKAFSLNKQNGDLYLLLGLMERRKQNSMLSRKYFQKALQYKTAYPYVCYYSLGMAALKDKKEKEALSFLKKALELNPKNLHILRTLVQLYKSKGNIKKVLELRERIVTIDEKNLNDRAYLISYYFSEKKFQKVLELGKTFCYVYPYQGKIHILMGKAYMELKRYKEAYFEFKLLQNFPVKLDFDYYFTLGKVCILLGKKEEAKDALYKALKLNPNHKKTKALLKNLEK
ncbi:MAG: hypothetical protein D6785_12300, partial [Planctomycetota bacterium]